MASAALSAATNSGDLADLVSSSGTATVYPSDDTLLAVLQARFRTDKPYSRISSSNYIALNPYKILANVNDASAREYEERCYKDTNLQLPGTSAPQPHLYELAANMYLLMRRRSESQSLLFRGITGSGKTASAKLVLDQLLRMSSHSKREGKVAEQIKAFYTLLDSFGNAKTLMNPNASRHGRYLELHFNERGRIASSKVLVYALDKSRLNKLHHEERTYHVFYQFLAGCTPEERDQYGIEDLSDYALLASSGCYRLPGGPFSDDAVAMEDLRAAMKALGFKSKHTTAIFTLLIAILLLGNLEFGDGDYKDASAYVGNPTVLDQAARLLGIPAEELAYVLTNKTSYVRKELYTVLLSAKQSEEQRDALVRDLYAILFAFVVETANHKVAPSAQEPPPSTQIILLDQPGFQSRGPTGTGSMALSGPSPLIAAYGQNGFDEFCINYQDELVHSYVVRQTFDDAVGYNGLLIGDGVTLPSIATMDNSACIELLRGAQLSERAQRKPTGVLGVLNKACSAFRSGKSGEAKDDELLQALAADFGVHASFVASPSVAGAADRHLFGVNHYAGSVSYDVSHFIEKDTDILDPAFVTLLRGSSEGFVSKLFSGPSMAAEKHPRDETIVVQAQVSSRPLRQPTPIQRRDRTLSDDHLILDPSKVYPVTSQLNYNLSELLHMLDNTRAWTVSCIRPNDSGSANSFDKRRVKAQIRSLLIPDMVARRHTEFICDFEQAAFCDRYVPTMRGSEGERIRQCAQANGWKEGHDYVLGHRLISLSYPAWKMVEDVVRAAEKERKGSEEGAEEDDLGQDDATEYTHMDPSASLSNPFASSRDHLPRSMTGDSYALTMPQEQDRYASGGLVTPTAMQPAPMYSDADSAWSEWDKKERPDSPGGSPMPPHQVQSKEEGSGLINRGVPNAVEALPTTRSRRLWLLVVWGSTWWIPSFLLSALGRMKRPDIRLAWREKLTICLLIFFLNAVILFYIIEFGRLLCPNLDKVWSQNEVAEHTKTNDYWVSIQGFVYDVTNFVHGQHSDIPGLLSNDPDSLDALAGQDLTQYFPVPLHIACSGLVSDASISLTLKNDTRAITQAEHNSGSQQSAQNTKLDAADWYTARFLPTIKQYRKGPLVITKHSISSQAADTDIAKVWGVYKSKVFDLTDYVNTLTVDSTTSGPQAFIDENVLDVFKQQAGQDITKPLNKVFESMDHATAEANLVCMENAFQVGELDFRKTPRCRVQNFLLLAFSIVLVTSIGIKFLSALQLAPKRSPELLDKFVICQIPCYTEGEESLRRTIDSLAALKYDDKRKLMFVICDGNIIGSGNDRTTPRIVLDILGVDPKLDPEPLLFKSIGEGSKQLNYGKVYSGLYEFEGHVVPYMVVVKVGKPTERSKPGNRGKRDSQILVMQYLNRVHFDSPMNPLELEIYHQMRNVIGIDPAFYEYIFTVDADTTVSPDSLNRLVASSADDSSIIGICGETRLENPEGSWWTMIQVYEYYISHHLSKAFESLFGSVTCLPGCFSLYRIRTADKGRPILISNRIIDEYSEPNVDTLHKKNLFSLGEDRFLTTLLMKHFPTFKTKFIPDALAHTVAPESWRVLLSQRRRWINSTVHNLCELVMLPELFGFCCFSMRFFVFIDLLGTVMLPSTVCYIVYLIVTTVTGNGAIPIISLIMIAAVYGLQALIFILKREFMLIGWMVVYIISYPVYSFLLPLYSFWCMDEFGWGSTRVVVGEGKDKKVIMNDDEKYDDSMIPLKKFSEYEAEAWEQGSHYTGEDRNQSFPRPSGSRAHSPLGGSPYQQASQSGDYYRDTNAITPQRTGNSGASHRLPRQGSHTNMSQYGGQPGMSMYGPVPQLPFMPFASGPGSVAGSDYGGAQQMPMGMGMGMAGPMAYQPTGGSMSMYGAQMPVGLVPQFTGGAGSMYGGMPGAPRNTVAGGLNLMGGDVTGSQSVLGVGGGRPMSTFSMATSVNPFAGPSQNENPSDEELFNALRNYLSTQDLMTVTKKTAREAIMARFPKADLSSRKDYLNESIDKILSTA